MENSHGYIYHHHHQTLNWKALGEGQSKMTTVITSAYCPLNLMPATEAHPIKQKLSPSLRLFKDNIRFITSTTEGTHTLLVPRVYHLCDRQCCINSNQSSVNENNTKYNRAPRHYCCLVQQGSNRYKVNQELKHHRVQSAW